MGADGLMLSGETAIGKYCLEAAAMVRKIANEVSSPLILAAYLCQVVCDGAFSAMTTINRQLATSIPMVIPLSPSEALCRVNALSPRMLLQSDDTSIVGFISQFSFSFPDLVIIIRTEVLRLPVVLSSLRLRSPTFVLTSNSEFARSISMLWGIHARVLSTSQVFLV